MYMYMSIGLNTRTNFPDHFVLLAADNKNQDYFNSDFSAHFISQCCGGKLIHNCTSNPIKSQSIPEDYISGYNLKQEITMVKLDFGSFPIFGFKPSASTMSILNPSLPVLRFRVQMTHRGN